MTITLRVDKGSPLTIEEGDENFTDLDGRLQVVEDNQTTYRSIEEITQAGNSLTVVYTDLTTDGPFTFEVVIRYRGEWEVSTTYAQNDLVQANGVVYFVAIAHISDSLAFDPGATDGGGNDLYVPFLSLPELSLPVGGDEGYVLAKASDDDHDMEWRNSAVPAGGTTGQVLVKLSDDDNDVDWDNAPVPPVATITADTFHPGITQGNVYFRCTNEDGCLVYIPENSEVAFAIGTELTFRQCTAGSVLLVGQDSDSTVTINATVGYEPLTALQGAVMTAKKVGLNVWDVFGLLAAEEASDTA